MTKKILAVSSSGGHWEQLMIISASFEGHQAHYATTIPGLAEKSGVQPAYLIADCNRNRPMDNLKSAWEAFNLVRTIRPNFVISTGAAPGLFALVFGKLFGARVIWVDSVANSEQLSMSGKIAAKFVDLHLVQWEHLLEGGRTRYLGSVL